VSIGVSTIFAALLLALVVVAGTNKRIYVVHTGSMTPTIPIKSAVLVDKRSYHVGQVISFRENGEVVTHRFVGLNPDGTLITKGDGNTTVDPWKTTRADVIGGVVAAPRELGYWLMYLRNPAGLGSLIGCVVCITLIWSIANSATRSEADADVTEVRLPDAAAPAAQLVG
jgi:signal peptidase